MCQLECAKQYFAFSLIVQVGAYVILMYCLSIELKVFVQCLVTTDCPAKKSALLNKNSSAVHLWYLQLIWYSYVAT